MGRSAVGPVVVPYALHSDSAHSFLSPGITFERGRRCERFENDNVMKISDKHDDTG